MLKLLNDCTPYLLELAALQAHSLVVRLRAISLLECSSLTVLQRIVDKNSQAQVCGGSPLGLENLHIKLR